MQNRVSREADGVVERVSRAGRATAIAALVLVLFGLPLPRLAAESEQVSSPNTSLSGNPAKTRVFSQADLSRAFMNCLIEVDKTMSVLASNSNNKAVRAETKSQRAFCENRKRDCLAQIDSPECRTFISEFERSDLVEGVTTKGKYSE